MLKCLLRCRSARTSNSLTCTWDRGSKIFKGLKVLSSVEVFVCELFRRLHKIFQCVVVSRCWSVNFEAVIKFIRYYRRIAYDTIFMKKLPICVTKERLGLLVGQEIFEGCKASYVEWYVKDFSCCIKISRIVLVQYYDTGSYIEMLSMFSQRSECNVLVSWWNRVCAKKCVVKSSDLLAQATDRRSHSKLSIIQQLKLQAT